MATNRTPARKCVGCGEMKDRTLLIRVTKNALGEIRADFSGKADGRGAYICKNPACLQTARKRKGFERAFSGKIPEEVFLALEAACAGETAGKPEKE
ncbi:MAG: YlxR family protein [Clostridiales bacterium]|nr:YlxR family protein [Candidatus Coliplasma caballi]